MILSKIIVYNKYLVILLTLYSFCGLVCGESNLGVHHCCNNITEIVFGDSECLDHQANSTRNISLTCEHGQYVAWKDLDENDNYTIEGSELVLVVSKNRVPWDSYCIGEDITEHGWREVAVMCFILPGTDYTIVFKGIMAFISVLFLAATLYVYMILPQLRETQDKVTIICISCLAMAFIFLGCLQVIPNHHFVDFVCIGLAFLVYIFIIAYFSWLNVVTANVFKSVVLPRWEIKERTWYILNHIYAWSVPIILTIVLVVSQHTEVNTLHPRIGEQTCFIDVRSQWLYLYTPLTTMLVINVIQIIIIAVMLYKFSRDMISTSRTRALKHKFILYFKLSVIAGLTWIFEIFAYAFNEWGNYWIVTDSLNALHGALIFLALIVFRKRIRRELAGKRICCCHIPQEWNRINDSEGGGCSEETKQDNINIRSQNGFQECE